MYIFPPEKGDTSLPPLLPLSHVLVVNCNYLKTLASNIEDCYIASTVTTCVMNRQDSTEPWYNSKLCNTKAGKRAKHFF